MTHRFYKDKQHQAEEVDIDTTMVQIDNQSFRQPKIISVAGMAHSLNVQFSKELVKDRNLSILEFDSQEIEPEESPNPEAIVQKTFMAIDENFLYVWIPSLKKWKRIPLSNW